MGKIEETINIDEHLWTLAKDELPMPREEFIEYCLRLYFRQDTQTSKLFKKAVNLQSQLDKVEKKLYKLQTRNSNVDNTERYLESMNTVYRIQKTLGYVGRNQLEKIATRQDYNIHDWISYVEKQEGIKIENYGALPK